MNVLNLTKEQIAKAIIIELEIESIHFKKYDSSNNINWKPKKEELYPDVRTSCSKGKINFYKIGLSNKMNKLKWCLFSLFANLNSREFIRAMFESKIGNIESITRGNSFKNMQLIHGPN